jgi:hypothetical protein
MAVDKEQAALKKRLELLLKLPHNLSCADCPSRCALPAPRRAALRTRRCRMPSGRALLCVASRLACALIAPEGRARLTRAVRARLAAPRSAAVGEHQPRRLHMHQLFGARRGARGAARNAG